jgi:hypothetical protein
LGASQFLAILADAGRLLTRAALSALGDTVVAHEKAAQDRRTPKRYRENESA